MGGKYRKCYVERIVIWNINNAKIADAVIAKIDIIEQHIKDSIAFEKRTTIPLEYSAYYDSYYSAPYVGGIYSVGNVTYNGKDYGKNGSHNANANLCNKPAPEHSFTVFRLKKT
jgi:hypothetical protein